MIPNVRRRELRIFFSSRGGQLFVEFQPPAHVRNVFLWEIPRAIQGELGLDVRADRLASKLGRRLFQKLAEHFDSHGGYVSGLLGAEEISRPAQLHVHGATENPEPRSV